MSKQAVTTVDLVKAYSEKKKAMEAIEAVQAYDLRIAKFLSAPSLNNLRETGHGTLLKHFEELEKLGFGSWIVGAPFVRKFAFHAVVRIPHMSAARSYDDVPVTYGSSSRETYEVPFYTGYIPESVLTRLEQAKSVLPFMTIHSNQEMPISREKVVPVADPVVVGWPSNPGIRLGYIRQSIIKQINNRAFGVVLGVWDLDKEAELA